MIVTPVIGRALVVVEILADGECTFTRHEGGDLWGVSTRGHTITIRCNDTVGTRDDAASAELLRRLATIMQARPEPLDALGRVLRGVDA